MDINQEILNRIAEALERISPNIDEKIDLSRSDGFLYDNSLIVYYDESFKTFLISLLLPISIPVILIFCLCVLYSYVSIGFSCFEKILSGESWDFLETLWFISLFFDDN